MTLGIRDIVRQIEDATQGSQSIPALLVKQWMSSPILEVKGAVANLLRKHASRISPSLSVDEICGAFERYYRGCLVENVEDGDYVSNRYVAGHELASWFRVLWDDPAIPREYLRRLKTILRELYLGDEDLRKPIVDAVLEHLFETAEIADFFSDWTLEPTLKEGFDRAMDWVRKDPSKARR